MKKVILLIIEIIILIGIVYFGIYKYQNHSLKKSFSIEKKESFKEAEFVRCNWNIFNPEFAYTFPGTIGFYKSNNLFYQTKEEWNQNRTGGTTVKNTTFPQLLEMVKEDCEQFKKPKGERTDKTINWSYGKYKPPKEKTPEEIEKERLKQERILKDIQEGRAQPTIDDIEGLEFIPKEDYEKN